MSIAILFRCFLDAITRAYDPFSRKPQPPKSLRDNGLPVWAAVDSRIFQPSGRMMACIDGLWSDEGPKVRWDLSI